MCVCVCARVCVCVYNQCVLCPCVSVACKYIFVYECVPVHKSKALCVRTCVYTHVFLYVYPKTMCLCVGCECVCVYVCMLIKMYGNIMSLIHYSFALLILFFVPYTLDLLPYYLSIANGAGGVGIFELLIFQCFV